MDYKIISFDQSTGSIVVRYREDMSPINIDLPLNDDGLFIVGEELDTYIKGFIPVWHLERIDRLSQGIANSLEIEKLVQPEEAVDPTTAIEENLQAIENAKMWEQVQFEKQIADVLVKFGVLPNNPVTIPVAEL